MTPQLLRTAILLLMSFLTFSTASSQSIPSFENYYSIGYSVGPGQGVILGLDKLVTENNKGAWGIGGLINIRSKSIESGEQTNFLAAGKLSYHPYLVESPRLDLYCHVAVGVGQENIRNDNRYTGPREESETTYTAWGLAAGARFKVIGRLGIYAEVGYGIGYANMGVTWNH